MVSGGGGFHSSTMFPGGAATWGGLGDLGGPSSVLSRPTWCLLACPPCPLLTGNGLAPGSPALPLFTQPGCHGHAGLIHPSSYAGGAGWECERLKGVTVGLPSFLVPLKSIRLVGVASPGLGCLSPRLTIPPAPAAGAFLSSRSQSRGHVHREDMGS